jgi:hypothetical protein
VFRQHVLARIRQARVLHPAILRRAAPFTHAVALAAVLAGAAFVAEALVLPRPTSAQLLAVQADRWLVRHRVVQSVQRFGGGRHVRTTCVETWFGPDRQIPGRHPGALLVTSEGGPLIAVRREVYRALHLGRYLADDDAPAALVRFQLAGCTWLLGVALSTVLENRLPLRFARTTIDGQPALRFGFGRSGKRVDLFVDPKTYRPLAVQVGAARSRIRPASFTVAPLVRRFRLLTNPRARPRL